MVYDCISTKLSELKEFKRTTASSSAGEINDLKLKVKEAERAEKQLIDTILSGGLNDDLLALANQKATQLKKDKMALYDRIEELSSRDAGTDTIVNLAKSWSKADYARKKEVAMIMIQQIVIGESGDTKMLWNI